MKYEVRIVTLEQIKTVYGLTGKNSVAERAADMVMHCVANSCCYLIWTREPEDAFPIFAEFVCPRCGCPGGIPIVPQKGGWTLDNPDKPTLRPSIVCSCGGHYWMTDGWLNDL